MTPKIVKVEGTQYFDYRPFTPSFMLVNQLEEEALVGMVKLGTL